MGGVGGGENRSATKFRKNSPKYANFSTVLSKIEGRGICYHKKESGSSETRSSTVLRIVREICY